jgi:hypothetical protein
VIIRDQQVKVKTRINNLKISIENRILCDFSNAFVSVFVKIVTEINQIKDFVLV